MPPSSEKKNPDGITRRAASAAPRLRRAPAEEKKPSVRTRRASRGEQRSEPPTDDVRFFDALRTAASEAREESRERFGVDASMESPVAPAKSKMSRGQKTSSMDRTAPAYPQALLAEPRALASLVLVRRIFSRPLWAGIAGVAVFGLFMLLLSTAFARVTVALKPRVENLAVDNIAVTFDIAARAMSQDIRIVPAELVEHTNTFSKEFQATGRSLVEDRSRGKVRIYNNFSIQSQSIVAQTRFLTDEGVLYRTPRPVVIPGATKGEGGVMIPQFVETELVADQAGEKGNLVGEVMLRIPGFKGTPKYEGFYAKAISGFSGGFKGEAQVISADDLKRAGEEVTASVGELVEKDASKEIPTDFVLVPGLKELTVKNVTAPPLGMRAETFTIEASGVTRALIFREDDVIALLGGLLLQGDGEDELVSDSAKFEYIAKQLSFDKGKAEVVIKGSVKSRRVVRVDELRTLMAGKKEGSAAELLRSRSEIAAFRLKFFPPWIGSVPRNSSKIHVMFE